MAISHPYAGEMTGALHMPLGPSMCALPDSLCVHWSNPGPSYTLKELSFYSISVHGLKPQTNMTDALARTRANHTLTRADACTHIDAWAVYDEYMRLTFMLRTEWLSLL